MHPHTNTLTHGHLIALCKDGDLKLVGSKPENEGRLEVCFDQRWGTINGNGWTYADTQVACRQLGYSTSGMKKLCKAGCRVEVTNIIDTVEICADGSVKSFRNKEASR